MSLIDDILERFGVPRTRPAAPPEAVVYQLGGDWGDAIWWPHGSTRVLGWKRRIPAVGDVLLAPMEGKMARWRFVKVRRPGDLRDMFFADVEFLGYEGSS